MDALSIGMIRRSLRTDVVGVHIHLFETVPSTNATLSRLARDGAPEGTVVLAETQTAGRGRLGKAWFSPPGVNLYASVLFRPRIAPAAVPVFAFTASLALVDAIYREALPATIKWPNDVLVEGKKVAGVLAESAIRGDTVEYVILGVGVNLNVTRAVLREALGKGWHAASSLSAAAEREIDRNQFAGAFLTCLERWRAEYVTRGPDAVLAAWRDREVLGGRRVAIREAGEAYDGRVVGLDGDGHLLVQGSGGERHRVLSGEVRMLE